jgi:hypothetical protein
MASGGEDPEAPSPDAGAAPPEVDVRSRAPALKRKTGAQLARDLSNALEIERASLCNELGRYDCVDEAHRIVLGGVAPYALRIDEPLPAPGVGSPIATDRLALSACGARARADFTGAPVVFGALARGAPNGRREAVRALYDRLLGRDPDPAEFELLSSWTQPNMTDEDFATLACFVLATSLEHLFY